MTLRLFIFSFLGTLALTAQQYNVRVGTFQDARADDFVELRELGFVYGQSRPGQLTDVYIGNYSSQERATEVTEALKSRGFRSAAPFALPVDANETKAYIQIALRGRNRSLDWRNLERAGKLFVDATDGVTKVVTGPYPTTAAATAALGEIRELGFADAFVKTLPVAGLIEVGVFETGIKKPLIPIQLRQVPADTAIPASQVAADTSVQTQNIASQPQDIAAQAPNPTLQAAAVPTPPHSAAATTTEAPPADEVPAAAGISRVPAQRPGLPAIDVKTKRHSAAELQRVLKERGYYEGAIDGYYGNGTRTAYEAAWAQLPSLRKYRLLAAADGDGAAPGNVPASWPEVTVALAVADDLAAGMENADADREMQKSRAALLNATTPLEATATARARNWETTVWANLDEWATEDPLHAQLLTALRIAYYQSQARLEAMYLQRGLDAIAARNLATASLENLLGAKLDRFL